MLLGMKGIVAVLTIAVWITSASGNVGLYYPPLPMLTADKQIAPTSVATSLPPSGPTLSPSLCVNQPDGTLLAHPTDCAKFIDCVGGRALEESCPPDLYWNDAKKQCDYRENVNCGNNPTSVAPSTPPSGPTLSPSLCVNQPDGTLLAHPTDCAKFIDCVGGHALEESCPPDLYWNDAKKQCDYRENVNCGNNSSSTAPPLSTLPPTSAATSSPSSEPTQPPSACSNQPDGTLLAHPTDCAKFIECVEGKAIEESCPRDLYWNDATKQCDFRENVNCGNIPPSTTIPPPSSDSTLSPSICANLADGTFLAHPTDCAKFIECVGGQAIVDKCSTGLYWNQAIKNCDYKENVNCGSDALNTELSATQPGSTLSPSICANLTDGTLLAHPTDCTKFIECVGGQAIEDKCPTDLYWNQAIKNCDYKENVICGGDASICENLADGTFLAHPTDCAKFFECVGGQAIEDKCPAGLYWNQAIKNCDFKEHVNCSNDGLSTTLRPPPLDSTTPPPSTTLSPPPSGSTPPSSICSNQADDTLLAHPTDCAKFIECVGGQAIEENCPPDLYWNDATKECDYRENVNCGSN